MNQENTQLAGHCRQLAELTEEAARWAAENRDIVRSEHDSLQRELRKTGRQLRTCAAAAARKMCVGVFGPSQAGKSYLVSVFARDESGGLLTDFAGQTIDFVKDINPEGGRESTGLVTRFTTDSGPSPAGHPVRLQLLSETDLVKILANTYYADWEHLDPPDPALITAELDSLEKSAPESTAGGISLDDLEDLREYLDKDFRGKPRVQELNRIFWNRALAVGTRLDLAGRVRLYAQIWDNVPALTSLLQRLLEALHALGCPAEAFAPLEALIPRETSIIDVRLLMGLANPPEGENLQLMTMDGRSAVLPRAVVAAITAELCLSMHNTPDPLFNHTDLLDFPGYRSRKKLTGIRTTIEDPEVLRESFLRGKVAFLFQRYCARRELTSMLLCVGPSNQDVQELPAVINEWVLATHGETPELRDNKDSTLYFVLTKSDAEFEDKAGVSSVESRWDIRIESSLLKFLGSPYEWPRKWNSQGAFKNLFLLRNPNIRNRAFFKFDDNEQECGYNPEGASYINALKTAFLNSTTVADHFANPPEAWEALMTLRDGGISLLRERLRPVCEPSRKRTQLAVTLAECCERLKKRLSPFWQSNDMEEVRAQKAALFRKLSGSLINMASQQRLGDFLYRMGLRDADLHDLYFEAEQQAIKNGTPTLGASASTVVNAEDILDDLADLFADAPLPEVPQTHTQDAPAAFAELVESRWLQKLYDMGEDTALLAYLNIPAKEYTDMVNELALAARRTGLRETLENDLRRLTSFANMDRERLIWIQASRAAVLYNEFISWLGCNPRTIPAEARTEYVNGNPIVLFEPPKPFTGMPELSETPSAHERQWYSHWLRALNRLFMHNASFDGNDLVNVEQNARLGKIIRGLAPQEKDQQ